MEPHVSSYKNTVKMKLPFKTPTIFSSNFLLAVLVLAAVSFCPGCDRKQGIKIGDTPPGFSGMDIKGELASLSRLKGKVVVLYFWTNSCCGGRLKLFEPFFSKNREKGLAMVAINVGDTDETVVSYAKSNALTFTLLTDTHGMISRQYSVFGFPTIFILDRNGVIREKILGDIQTAKLEKLVSNQLDNTLQPK